MTSFGFGLSEIINVTFVINGSNTTNSTSAERTGKLTQN